METVLLVVSSKERESLQGMMDGAVNRMRERKYSPCDAAFTLQKGRRALDYRGFKVWNEAGGDSLPQVLSTSPCGGAAFRAVVVIGDGEGPLGPDKLGASFKKETTALGKLFYRHLRRGLVGFEAQDRARILEAITSGAGDSESSESSRAAAQALQVALVETLGDLVPSGIEFDKNLSGPVDQCLYIKEYSEVALLEVLGHMWLAGAQVNWEKLYGARPCRVSMPLYPFAKTLLPSEISTGKEEGEPTEKRAPEKKNPVFTLEVIKEELISIWKNLLGLDGVLDKDDFLRLGGDSLNMVQMGAALSRKFGVLLPMDLLFEHTGLGQLAQLVKARLDDKVGVAAAIPRVADAPHYPASYAQKRMYGAQGMDPEGTAYNLGACYRLEGPLDIDRLKEVFYQLVLHHEALRTSFHILGGDLVQKIGDPGVSPLEISWLEEGVVPDVSKLIEPFDLSRAPLMRAKLLRSEEEINYLFFDMHHIIGDQFSIAIILEAVNRLYAQEPLEVPKVRYVDYSDWQQKNMNEETLGEALDYWRGALARSGDALERFYDFPKDGALGSDGRREVVQWSLEDTQRIKGFAKENGMTVYMLMVAAYGHMLHRYGGVRVLNIGTAVAGRPLPELSGVVGMFVNNLPLPLEVLEGQSVAQYLAGVKATIGQVFKYQDIPFDLILERLRQEGVAPQEGLFDVCINYVNMGVEDFQLDGIECRAMEAEGVDSKYDLTLTVIDGPGGLAFEAEYRRGLFKDATIKRFLGHVARSALALTQTQSQTLQDVDFTTDVEKANLALYRGVKTPAPIEMSTVAIFEGLVSKNPGAPALTWLDQTYDYGTLASLAKGFSHHLYGMGVRKGNRVGLLLNQGPAQVVAILGILKLGAVYVPMGVEAPVDRICFMLEDSGCGLCVTDLSNAWEVQDALRLGKVQCHVERMPALEGLISGDQVPYSPEDLGGSDDMYIIYTSGSTGKPKGVLLTHQGVIRTVVDTNYYHITPQDRITQMINYTFDPSVMEIFGGLLNGAHIFMIPKGVLMDFPAFESYIKGVGITKTIFVTPVFHMLVDYNPKALEGLKKVFIGGEALSPKHVKRALEVVGPGNIVNVYGPTEGTIVASSYQVNRVDPQWKSVPIGRAIAGANLYVVDHRLNPLPPGITGELIITGPGLARGYINRDELSAEKFVVLPFSGEVGYRTSDYVVMDDQYYIHFKGRMDNQVKIHGYRIEIDEIKHKMLALAGVADAFVRVNKGQYIEAYYTLHRDFGPLSAAAISQELSKNLPAYMVPERMLELEAFPLTVNGKIDQRQLTEALVVSTGAGAGAGASAGAEAGAGPGVEAGPEPGAGPRPPEAAASDPVALILNQMRTVLNYQALSQEDDFFDFGGQSIKAIALSQNLREEGMGVSVNDIFARRTAIGIASTLTPRGEGEQNAQGPQGPQGLQGAQGPQGPQETKGSQGTIDLTPETVDMMVESFCMQAAHFTKMVGATHEEIRYEMAPIQDLHSSLGNDGTGFAAKFTAPDDLTVKTRIVDLIRTQDMLRAVLVRPEWVLKDLTHMEAMLVHSLQVQDFSHYAPKAQELLVERLYSKLVEVIYPKGEIPWRLFVAKLEAHQYIAIWCFDHLIFDGMSAQILTQGLEGKLFRHNNYRDYVGLLAKGPKLANGDLIRDKYGLDQWLRYNAGWMKVLEQNSVGRPMVLTIELPLEGVMANGWRRGYNVVKEIFSLGQEDKVPSPDIPLLVVNYGRHYEKTSFFDVAGEFLDFIPFYASQDGLESRLSFIHKNATEDRMNFVWLMQKGQNLESYKDVARDFAAIRSDRVLDSIILNFQGFIDSEQQDLFKNVRSEEIIPISKAFVNVFYDEETLTVMLYSEYGFTPGQISAYQQATIDELVIVQQQGQVG